MDQGKTAINGPHQGAWVELKTGQSWFIHFQDRGAYGRVVHLQPMKWLKDWPVIGIDRDGDGKGEPVIKYAKPNAGKNYPVSIPQTTDNFKTTKLALQWQWHANPQEAWSSLSERPGWLRLFSVSTPGAVNLWAVPNLILQKFPAPEFNVTTRLEFSKLAAGEKAGLIVMGMDYSLLAVEKTPIGYRIARSTCKNADSGGRQTEEASDALTTASLFIRVKVSAGGICRFAYSVDGQRCIAIGEPFTARAGKWIGAKVGLFCLSQANRQSSGYADFDWFRVERINGD